VDSGSGVQPASVQMTLTGTIVPALYAPLAQRLWYTATAFLPNGVYTYTIAAADTVGNQVTYSGTITVAVPAPAILGADPAVLPRGVTTTVVITGVNFGYPPTVRIDGGLVTDTGYQGTTALTATVPAILISGPHTVTVAAPDGQAGTKTALFTIVESSALVPQAPGLVISTTSIGVQLTWLMDTTSTLGYPVPITGYQVYRSIYPYFSPDGPTAVKVADLASPTWTNIVSYVDAAAFSLPITPYHYIVVANNAWGQASAVSNRVGAFNFALTPGGD